MRQAVRARQERERERERKALWVVNVLEAYSQTYPGSGERSLGVRQAE